MNDEDLIADLIRADVAPDLVSRVAAAIADARAEGAFLQGRLPEDDRSANARRQARYRERKRNAPVTEALRNVTGVTADSRARVTTDSPTKIQEKKNLPASPGRYKKKKFRYGVTALVCPTAGFLRRPSRPSPTASGFPDICSTRRSRNSAITGAPCRARAA